MNQLKSSAWFERMDAWELTLCLLLNRGSQQAFICRLFAIVSRLGNGVFWYALMAALIIVDGRDGIVAAAHMGLVGALGVFIYKTLKRGMVRQRPYIASAQIHLGAAPLDLYSFPSGHTLHAVSFTLIALSYYPALAWVLVPFSILVALSRVVLGLHYPTDVLVGLVIGVVLGFGSLQIAALY